MSTVVRRIVQLDLDDNGEPVYIAGKPELKEPARLVTVFQWVGGGSDAVEEVTRTIGDLFGVLKLEYLEASDTLIGLITRPGCQGYYATIPVGSWLELNTIDELTIRHVFSPDEMKKHYHHYDFTRGGLFSFDLPASA